jgi:hypothetical protein
MPLKLLKEEETYMRNSQVIRTETRKNKYTTFDDF